MLRHALQRVRGRVTAAVERHHDCWSSLRWCRRSLVVLSSFRHVRSCRRPLSLVAWPLGFGCCRRARSFALNRRGKRKAESAKRKAESASQEEGRDGRTTEGTERERVKARAGQAQNTEHRTQTARSRLTPTPLFSTARPSRSVSPTRILASPFPPVRCSRAILFPYTYYLHSHNRAQPFRQSSLLSAAIPFLGQTRAFFLVPVLSTNCSFHAEHLTFVRVTTPSCIDTVKLSSSEPSGRTTLTYHSPLCASHRSE